MPVYCIIDSSFGCVYSMVDTKYKTSSKTCLHVVQGFYLFLYFDICVLWTPGLLADCITSSDLWCPFFGFSNFSVESLIMYIRRRQRHFAFVSRHIGIELRLQLLNIMYIYMIFYCLVFFLCLIFNHNILNARAITLVARFLLIFP